MVGGPIVLVEARDLSVDVEGARKRQSDGSKEDWVNGLGEDGWESLGTALIDWEFDFEKCDMKWEEKVRNGD
jgi:hypothetical protein